MRVKMVKKTINDDYLTFDDKGIFIKANKMINIDYKSIDNIELNINAYMHMINIISVWYNFFIEITVNLSNEKHIVELANDDYILDFIASINKAHVNYIDKANVKCIYENYKDKVARNRYLELNLKKLPIHIKK